LKISERRRKIETYDFIVPTDRLKTATRKIVNIYPSRYIGKSEINYSYITIRKRDTK
jgi:hypothetical protein